MLSPFILRQAASDVLNGGVIAYPTEAVYGLGCDPYQPEAVYKILDLKDRPVKKGLILIGSQLSQFDDFIEPLNSEQQLLIKNNPTTTWLVPAEKAPIYLRGKFKTLAIRLSTHPTVVALCNQLQQPLVSTSANPAGKNPAKTPLMVQHYFAGKLDIILHDKLGELSKPTEIRDLLSGRIFRAQ